MLLVVAALMFWRSYRLRSDRREVTAMRRLAATGFATLAVALALDLPLVAIIGLFDLALGFGSLALGHTCTGMCQTAARARVLSASRGGAGDGRVWVCAWRPRLYSHSGGITAR
jgi:hypothetical protein